MSTSKLANEAEARSSKSAVRIGDLEQKLTDSTKSLDEQKKLSQRQAEELAALRKRVDAAALSELKARKTINDTDAQLKERDQSLEAAEQQAAAYKEQVTALGKAVEAASDQLAKNQKQNQMQSQRQAEKSRLDLAQAKRLEQKAGSELSEATARIQTLVSQVEELQVTNRDLENDVSGMLIKLGSGATGLLARRVSGYRRLQQKYAALLGRSS